MLEFTDATGDKLTVINRAFTIEHRTQILTEDEVQQLLVYMRGEMWGKEHVELGDLYVGRANEHVVIDFPDTINVFINEDQQQQLMEYLK